ncbi:hypothetical protein KP509_36G021500 [Ceratopteris richardii]|uniref:Uncharacterized protein n=1 Tax=Ceratopteris richardii TaxID=49495 RepID=A0A8T2QBE5_CERRI|nr:hypothetical protein KP509_36G021500 [Ceratopteris richardii]
MAHSSPSFLHPSSFVAQKSTQSEKLQDLLPPRKRILAGLKHVNASIAPTSSTVSPPSSPSFQIEMHIDDADISSVPPHSLLLRSSTEKCLSCGDYNILLHRVPSLAGSVSYHCTSCVLAINKHMYCVLCYQVLGEESHSLTSSFSSSSQSELVTCRRCKRLTHLSCIFKLWSPPLDGANLTLCRDCYTRNNGQCRVPPIKKLKTKQTEKFLDAFLPTDTIRFPLLDAKALAAARIVAIIAKRGALEAKKRAEALAKTAACAAAHAKTILENVYKQVQKDVNHHGHSDATPNVVKYEGSTAAQKVHKSLKKRALSAIVASERLSMRDHILSDGASKARSTIRRKRSLSAIVSEHSSKRRNTMMIVDPDSRKRKVKCSNPPTKGRLGAIVSHVLASNRLQKGLGKGPFFRAGRSGAEISINARNEPNNNSWDMDVMSRNCDRVANESLCISKDAVGAMYVLSDSL